MIKCAWCNSPALVPEGEKAPAAWTYRKCPDCDGMNKFRPVDEWVDDLKVTTIVTEMLSTSSTRGEIEPPREPYLTPRALDSDVARAISNIIKRKP